MENNESLKTHVESAMKLKWYNVVIFFPMLLFFILFPPFFFLPIMHGYGKENLLFILQVFPQSLSIKLTVLLGGFAWVSMIILMILNSKKRMSYIFYSSVIYSMVFLYSYYLYYVAIYPLATNILSEILTLILFPFPIVALFFKVRNLDKVNKFMNQINSKLPILIGVYWISNFFINFLSGIENLFYKSIATIFPIIVIFLYSWLIAYFSENMQLLWTVKNNQEIYRKKCGYSVKDWYGSRSKEYLHKEIND
jgi:hypothetical protein